MPTVNITTISTSSYEQGWSVWSKDQMNAFGYSGMHGCMATAIRFTVPESVRPGKRIRFSIPLISMVRSVMAFTASVSLTTTDPTKTSAYTQTTPGSDPGRVYMSVEGITFSDSATIFWEPEIDVQDLVVGSTMYLVLSADGTDPYAVRIESGANIRGYLEYNPPLSTVSTGAISTRLGEVTKINITVFDPGVTHTLRYSINGNVGLIAENVFTSCDWTPDVSLAEYYPSASEGPCAIICETYSEGDFVGSIETEHTLVVPESLAPTVSLHLSPLNDNPVVSEWGICLQNYSKIQAHVTYAVKYGAHITGCNITMDDGKSYEDFVATTDVVRDYGMKRVKAEVTDSRGLTTSVTKTIIVYYYSPPSVRVTACHRCGDSEEYSPNGENYYAIATARYSSCNDHNTASIFTRFRAIDGDFGNKSIMTSGAGGVYGNGQLSPYNSYIVEIMVADALNPDGYSAYTATIPQSKKSFHIKDGGKGVAIGTFAEIDDLFDVGYNARFQADVEIDSNEPVILFKSNGVLAGAIGSHSVDGVLGDMFIRVYDSSGAYKEYTWSSK